MTMDEVTNAKAKQITKSISKDKEVVKHLTNRLNSLGNLEDNSSLLHR